MGSLYFSLRAQAIINDPPEQQLDVQLQEFSSSVVQQLQQQSDCDLEIGQQVRGSCSPLTAAAESGYESAAAASVSVLLTTKHVTHTM